MTYQIVGQTQVTYIYGERTSESLMHIMAALLNSSRSSKATQLIQHLACFHPQISMYFLPLRFNFLRNSNK